MTPERFRQAEEVFQGAVALPPGDRAAFLDAACRGDGDLRAQVESLLAHDAGGHGALRAPVGPAVRELSEALLAGGAGEPPPPERVGSYRVVRPLGEGGFGVVYLAEQDSPRRAVALKLLRAPFATGSAARRLEYEGVILARLRHPGIAQVYEAGVAPLHAPGAGGAAPRVPFLAMEHVDGPNIVEYADRPGPGRPPLDARARLALFARVCDAVQYAHQRGVIHRDLKPDNILVAPPAGDGGEPQPKVLDFGVARVADPEGGDPGTRTLPGQVVGTLAYMSPEQVAGDPALIDTRTDVHALGVVLYQLLSGRLPYDVRGASLAEAARLVRERDPPPLGLRDPALGGDAEAIVRRALEKDRDRRYPSAGALAGDVRRCLAGEPVEARRDSGWYVARRLIRRHRAALGVGAAFVLLLAASSAVGWSLYGAAERARAQASALLRESYVHRARAAMAGGAPGRRAEALALVAQAAAIRRAADLRDEAVAALALTDLAVEREFPAGRLASARGLRRLDRLAVSPGAGQVRVLSAGDGREIARLNGPERPVAWMRFSPSGELLGVLYQNPDGPRPLRVWRLADARPVLSVETAAGAGAFDLFGQGEGARLAVADAPGRLRVVGVAGGGTVGEFPVRPGVFWIAADPAGRRLAASGGAGTPLEVLDLAGGEVLASIEADCDLRHPAWSPDGRLLAAGGSDFLVHVWDASSGQAVRVLEGHRATVSEVWLGEGLAASAAWDGTVRVWDLSTGREAFPVARGEGAAGFDGRRVAVLADRALKVMRLEGETPLRTLRAPGALGPEGSVDFSADGAWVAAAGACGVHLWPADGDAGVTLDAGPARCAFFAPAMGGLAALVEGRLTFWPLTGGVAGGARVVWSGSARAWASAHQGGATAVVCDAGAVRLVDLASGESRPLAAGFPGMERPLLTPDGRWLFLGTWRGEAARVVDTRNGRVVLQFGVGSVRGVFSPDGGRLAVALPGLHRLFRVGDWRSYRTGDWLDPDARSAGASAFSPDGALLAAGVPPHRVRLVDAASGATLASLPNPAMLGVTDLRLSPDGSVLAVATLEREVMLWRLDRLRAALRREGLDWE